MKNVFVMIKQCGEQYMTESTISKDWANNVKDWVNDVFIESEQFMLIVIFVVNFV